MESDEKLVARCLKGDKDAYESLVRKYQQRIFNIIYRITGSDDEVEDIAQEVFLKIFKSLETFREASSFFTWIYRMTVNACFNRIRKRNPALSLDDPDLVGFVERKKLGEEEEGQNPEYLMETGELSSAIRRAIDSLPPDYKAVIILRDIEGLSYQEIAEVLERPVGTVMSRLYRARKELKERLAPYLGINSRGEE